MTDECVLPDELKQQVEMRARELRAMKRLDNKFYAQKAEALGLRWDTEPEELAKQEILFEILKGMSNLTKAWEGFLIANGVF